MIGGALGAMFGAFMGLGATAYGVTGIPGYLTINKPLIYTIELLIAGGVAFGLTLVAWKEDEKTKKTEKETEAELDADQPTLDAPVVISTEAGSIKAPTKGKVISYTEITDDTFASGVLGEGVGIVPEEGYVVAPCDGVISSVTDTQHAVGITGPGDMELLIHVGVDTVKMEGKGFKTHVKEGEQVTEGQKLITFDRKEIEKAGYADTVVVLLTNSDDYKDFKYNTTVEVPETATAAAAN